MFDRVPPVAANEDTPPAVAISKRYVYDVGGNLIYEGFAYADEVAKYETENDATAAGIWAVRAFTYDVGGNLTDSKWADGNTDFDNVWDDRATLTYV